jgi:peptidoglycan/LPS O-acetylase OafA/YrhL
MSSTPGRATPAELATTGDHTRTFRLVAAAVAALSALIHFVEAPEYLEKTPYLGVLFIAGGLALVYVAVQLVRRPDPIAWTVGALVAAGMVVGGVLSRTVGLPGFHETDWEPLLLASLVLEVAYLALYVVARPR